MHKIKSFLGGIGITFIIWTIARFLPAIIGALYPNSVIFKLISFLAFLPLGWLASKKIAKGKYPRCIRVNLYIFAVLEISGLFTSVTYLIQSLSLSTGRYSTDAYGVPYSDYAMLYGMMLIFGIVYIVLCFKLANKTQTTKHEITPQEPIVLEKNHEKKQELRDQIAKLKSELKESEEAYIKNKKILEESYSDEDLLQMVNKGEFPVDRIEEYKDARRCLELLIASMPKERETIIGLIGNLSKELAELECE